LWDETSLPVWSILWQYQHFLIMTKNHGNQIKNDKQYEALRAQGNSKEKSARIANSDAHQTGKKGGSSSRYEDRTREDLYRRAKEVGIEGRSKMRKSELIDALRNH
jgi:hypothetical protein